MYETPFQLYDVLMIVGTENPKINQVPYIGLDQLINGEAVSEFAELLHEQVDIDSEAFKSQLIFNFSINKIVENLTILDATKVLRLVQKAVKELEKTNGDRIFKQSIVLALHALLLNDRTYFTQRKCR